MPKKPKYKKNTRIFFLLLILVIFSLIALFIVIETNIPWMSKFLISIIYMELLGVVIGFFIAESIKGYLLLNYVFRYKKVPHWFEFLSIFFFFIASIFIAFLVIYIRPTTQEEIMNLIIYYYLSFISYALALVFAYYHYIRREDCD